MRYTACTHKDITFLNTRISGRRRDQPQLNDSHFQYVSIITASNSQTDKINELGSNHFAHNTGKSLGVCSDANATTGVVLGFGVDGISKHPNTVIT